MCSYSTLPIPLTPSLSIYNLSPSVNIEVKTAYYAAHTAVNKVLYPSKVHKETTDWRQWDSFFQITHNLHDTKDPMTSLKTSLTRYIKESFQSRERPFRNEAFINTAATWGKY